MKQENLGARYWRLSRKLQWLADSFNSPAGTSGCDDIHAFGREGVVLQLQDQWSNFCRDLIYASWRGGVVTAGGTVIPPRPGRKTDYVAYNTLRATYTGALRKSRSWNPTWFDPVEAIDYARRLGVANLQDLVVGLGMTPSPLPELRAVRNYYAHKGRHAVSEVSRYVGTTVTPAVVHSYVASPTSGGAPLLERWAAQLDIMARAAVH